MVFIEHNSRKYATSTSCHRRRSGTSDNPSSIKGERLLQLLSIQHVCIVGWFPALK